MLSTETGTSGWPAIGKVIRGLYILYGKLAFINVESDFLNFCLLVICLMSVWMALYCVTVRKWKVWRDFKFFQCGKLMLPLEAALVDTGDILTLFELNNCGSCL